MATTSQITPGKDKDVSKGTGGESPSLLDAKLVGGIRANGVGGDLSTQSLQAAVKSKVSLFVRELDGFSHWQANHILECVREEIRGLGGESPIQSSDFVIGS